MAALPLDKVYVVSFLLLLTNNSATSIPRSGRVLFEYFPSSPKDTSDILRATLTSHDYENPLKILPENRDIILEVSPSTQIR